MMREKMLVSFVLVAFFAGAGLAGQYYVSLAGDDANPGTEHKPFRTMQKAADVMKAGDSCYIRGGRYHEAVVISGLKGTADKPITFTSYQDEAVTLDGTEPIKGKWQKYKGKIYKTKLTKDIWQLFVDGKMMISARWPNARFDDGSVWKQDETWAWQAPNSTYGRMYDDGKKNLAGTGIDFTGAIAILNIGSFRTFAQFVDSHSAGSDNFTYTPNLWDRLSNSVWWGKHTYQGRYYLESKLECLDTSEEWFYDPDTKQLYLWTDDGKDPAGRDVRGKNQSYALDISGSSYVNVIGLDFFATTFRLESCRNTTVEDCRLLYPSYSRRMVRDLREPEVTAVISPTDSESSNAIRNCVFEYTDGTGIRVVGKGDIIENCYFHDVDYSCVWGGGYAIDAAGGVETTFRRNTVHTTGPSEGYRVGRRHLVELNHIYNCGHLQSDGSQIQTGISAQSGTVICYNWSHNSGRNVGSVKQGIRFDGSFIGNRYGTDGTVHHNVAWRTQTIFIKGDNHRIYNNTSFDNQRNDLAVRSAAGQPVVANQVDPSKYGGWGPGAEHPDENARTITRNNLAGQISSSKFKPSLGLPGLHCNNFSGDVRSQLRDPDNLDFRPKADAAIVDAGFYVAGINNGYEGRAPEIGAYEYGAENYWIPGRKLPVASVPIPPDGAGTVKPDADLMWLGGYRAASHDIYFGKDKEAVAGANRKSGQYRGNQTNNIFEPGKLDAGKTYYWRIDAVDKSGVVTAGDVWSFTTEGL